MKGKDAQLEIAGTAKPEKISFSFITSATPMAAGNTPEPIREYNDTIPVSSSSLPIKLAPSSIMLLTIEFKQ